ncbi:MAG: hypothetical protein ABI113_00730 [Mucilaginibacter sp.]
MKKLIVTLMLIIGAYYQSKAQSSASVKIAVGSTYVSPVVTDVYPYQSGLHPKADFSIHFRLNKGTRFTVVAVKDSAGTIQGYVITPWNFNTNDTNKKAVYKLITDSARKKAAIVRQIQANIQKKQDSLNIVKEQLKKDSLLKIKAGDSLLSKKQALVNNTNDAFRSVININAKTALIPVSRKDKTQKKQVYNFNIAQTSAKIDILKGIEPDSLSKEQLINAAMVLPLKDKKKLTKYNIRIADTKTTLDKAIGFFQETSQKFDNNQKQYEQAFQELVALKSKIHTKSDLSQPRSDKSKPDPNAYRITKLEKNDTLDVAKNPASPAALYDELEYVDSWANGWQFFVTAKDFSQFESIYPSSHKFTWGFLTLPVKMRFDNKRGGRFDFEQNLNFGLTFGDRHQIVSTNDISLNYLVGLSVVSVPLNDATVSTAATSTAAISTSMGFMLQYNKFQIGAFLGRDFAGSHANQFNYQGKPWLGFAIGVSLFGEGKTTSSAQEQTTNP